MTVQSAASVYPARLEVDYPEQHDRVTTLFRVVLIIPIGIVIAVLTAGATQSSGGNHSRSGTQGGGIADGLAGATALMIVFRRRYPRWWFDFALELARFGARVSAYFVLLTDQYPSTVEQQSVHLQIDYPDVESDLNRWLPLVKWLLAIPHTLPSSCCPWPRSSRSSLRGSRFCSPDAIRGGCSISWSASAAGGCASRRTRSSLSRTAIRPSPSPEPAQQTAYGVLVAHHQPCHLPDLAVQRQLVQLRFHDRLSFRSCAAAG